MPRPRRSSTSVASADRPLYADSSALVKLIVGEPESAALGTTVGQRALVTSELALAEVPRAVRRAGGDANRAQLLLRGISYVPVDRRVLLRAGAFVEPGLRT